MDSTLLLSLIYGSYNTTQLYSNLVTYENNTTYLCLVLAVLCSPVFLRVRLALLYTNSLLPHSSSHHVILFLSSLASIPLLLITEDKGRPTHGHKTKSWFGLMEVGTSCFTIFGKDVSG